MDRQKIIDGCPNSARLSSSLLSLIRAHPAFFTELQLEPLCMAEVNEPSSYSCASSSNSSLSGALSFASNMSRVDMERVLLKEVLKNRAEHRLFSELDRSAEGEEPSTWYFLHSRNESIHGPFSSAEMDCFFAEGQFNESSKLKRKHEEDYYAFFLILKRYFKKILEERLAIGREKSRLPKKVAVFKRGCKASKKEVDVEEIELKGRNYRVLSSASKPMNLNSLLTGVAAEEDEESEEEQEPVIKSKRVRANTLAV